MKFIEVQDIKPNVFVASFLMKNKKGLKFMNEEKKVAGIYIRVPL